MTTRRPSPTPRADVARPRAAVTDRRHRAHERHRHRIAASGSRGWRRVMGCGFAKLLETGAVLDVPAGTLEAVANDSEVDHLSTNYLVEAHMGVTNQTIGADLVQAGRMGAGHRRVHRRRHRRRGDRYRRRDDAGAAWAHHREPRLHGRARSGPRPARTRDARGRHHRGVGREPLRRDARRGAGREHHQPEGAGRAGQGPGGQRHRGD